MFDTSSSSTPESSRDSSPKFTFTQITKQPKPKPKYSELLTFVSSNSFFLLICGVAIIPLILYQHERPSLFCTNGLYYFCKPCPKNSICSITTFECKENTTQFHNQCITGKHDTSILDNIYNSYKNGSFSNSDFSLLTNEDLLLIMESKDEFFIDDQGEIHKIKYHPLVNYISAIITLVLLMFSIRYGIEYFFA